MLFWALAQEWEFIPASEQVQSAQQNKPAFLIAGYWYHFEPRSTSPPRARVELYNIIIIYLGNIRDIAGHFILRAVLRTVLHFEFLPLFFQGRS